MLILLLLVLLLFGPRKIPEIARMIGRGMNEVKKVQREINTEIHKYSSDIEREAREMESEINKVADRPVPGQAGGKNKSEYHLTDKQVAEDTENASNAADKSNQGTGSEIPDEQRTRQGQPDEGEENDLPYPYHRNTDD